MSDAPLVLVVDDEEPVRYTIAEALQLDGYLVDTASNGQEALEKIQRACPSAIVLDLMMPVMDGWAFVDACRNFPPCAQTPILVISAAHGLQEAATRLREKGVRAVMAKPFELDALLGAIERLATHRT